MIRCDKKEWPFTLRADRALKPVPEGHQSSALIHFEGKFNALDNCCPHQGGPLGIRVESRNELDHALKKLFAHDGPGMVEIISDVNLI